MKHPATFALPSGMMGGAVFSADGAFRHYLWRAWASEPLAWIDPSIPRVMEAGGFQHLSTRYVLFIGHNPSRADAQANDMTMIREIGFARREGFGCLIKVNLSDYCATDPAELPDTEPELVSVRNDTIISQAALHAFLIILATGNPFNDAMRARFTFLCDAILPGYDLYCLGTTRDGYPRHTSRLANDAPLFLYLKGAA